MQVLPRPSNGGGRDRRVKGLQARRVATQASSRRQRSGALQKVCRRKPSDRRLWPLGPGATRLPVGALAGAPAVPRSSTPRRLSQKHAATLLSCWEGRMHGKAARAWVMAARGEPGIAGQARQLSSLACLRHRGGHLTTSVQPVCFHYCFETTCCRAWGQLLQGEPSLAATVLIRSCPGSPCAVGSLSPPQHQVCIKINDTCAA